MKITCGDCEHARQVGDKKIQHIVGCTKLLHGEIHIVDVVNSDIYEGYMYGCRRVGDVSESKTLGKGTLTLGMMTESKGSCKMATARDFI